MLTLEDVSNSVRLCCMHVWPINVSMIMMPGVILPWVRLHLTLVEILIWCYAMNQIDAVRI